MESFLKNKKKMRTATAAPAIKMLGGAIKMLFSPMLASDFTRNDGLVLTGDVSAPTGTVSVQALVAPGGDALLLAPSRLGLLL